MCGAEQRPQVEIGRETPRSCQPARQRGELAEAKGVKQILQVFIPPCIWALVCAEQAEEGRRMERRKGSEIARGGQEEGSVRGGEQSDAMTGTGPRLGVRAPRSLPPAAHQCQPVW